MHKAVLAVCIEK